jgi:tryptophan halogenase
LAKKQTLSDIQFTSYVSENNCVKYTKNFEELGSSALHFDANLLAEYLKTVALSRGVVLIDDVVLGFVSKSNGDISHIKLKSQEDFATDFVFDCTGFKRLIIGKHFNAQWKTYNGSLPVNRAVPFFIDNTSNIIPPYTESIAMKYGWMWKIPVQGRFGCGYVFDSNLASDEDIKKELTEYLGYEPTIPRVFSFEPGAYETTWINNCVAIGLSSGFVEPLEATSIQVSTYSLAKFADAFRHVTAIKDKLEKNKVVSKFNHEIKQMNDHVLTFLQFHYLSKRSDTIFWTQFRQRNTLTPFLNNFEKLAKQVWPKSGDYEYMNAISAQAGTSIFNAFSLYSWQMVGAGNEYFDDSMIQKELSNCIKRHKNIDIDLKEQQLKELLYNISQDTLDHYDYIEYLKTL